MDPQCEVMHTSDMMIVTATAPVNIAVIKYWGKRNEELILPINGSISATLNMDQMRAKTTVAASRSFKTDRLWLNSVEQSMADNARLRNVLNEIRRRARKRRHQNYVKPEGQEEDEEEHYEVDGGDGGVDDGRKGNRVVAPLTWKVHICSENNFPTAAGLASSAAGFACLVFALSKLFGIDGDISDIARQGSGSACRSVYGGFVEWTLGEDENGLDSVARQIAPETHWPDMEVLILVVSGLKKHTGSTAGMQTSVATSRLLLHRAKHLVPAALEEMTAAIKRRDFQVFSELTMKDSNQMHAVCMDTYPPIAYLTECSQDIIRLIHAINDYFGHPNKVAYTFDAGPNACLYLLRDDVPLILGLISHFFPHSNAASEQFITGIQTTALSPTSELIHAIPLSVKPGAVQYVIHTKVGGGPRVFSTKKDHLLDGQGWPLSLELITTNAT